MAASKKSKKPAKATGSREAMAALEEIMGGPLTLGGSLRSMRELIELTQVQCAERLGISRSQLCDVEKDRRSISPEKAHQWAVALQYPPEVFVQLALQAQVDRLGLKCKVVLEAA